MKNNFYQDPDPIDHIDHSRVSSLSEEDLTPNSYTGRSIRIANPVIRISMIALFGLGLLAMLCIFLGVYSARGFNGLVEFIKIVWF